MNDNESICINTKQHIKIRKNVDGDDEFILVTYKDKDLQYVEDVTILTIEETFKIFKQCLKNKETMLESKLQAKISLINDTINSILYT